VRLASCLSRAPLRGAAASAALLAVASPASASALLTLAAERQTSGAEVLALVRGMLREPRLAPPLLETLRSLRAPRFAWGAERGGGGKKEGEEAGQSHLALLFPDLVHACATAEDPATRRAAALCLLEAGKDLK
jgi:hypothetical protein